ncbi:MAG: transcriptional repressor [Chloracidobacterium sp.]|nr:transcriptional repressor [Chloracidobacterium sp.]MCC6825580.1 transcriptional repressor [Acidobacteriota bacterium]
MLSVIRESHDHLTANEVFSEAKAKLPTISFATVYNSLRFLKDTGHIAELQFGNGASRYDRTTVRHDHAICTGCGKLVDIDMKVSGEMIEAASRQCGFEPESLEFTLRGKCPECAHN